MERVNSILYVSKEAKSVAPEVSKRFLSGNSSAIMTPFEFSIAGEFSERAFIRNFLEVLFKSKQEDFFLFFHSLVYVTAGNYYLNVLAMDNKAVGKKVLVESVDSGIAWFEMARNKLVFLNMTLQDEEYQVVNVYYLYQQKDGFRYVSKCALTRLMTDNGLKIIQEFLFSDNTVCLMKKPENISILKTFFNVEHRHREKLVELIQCSMELHAANKNVEAIFKEGSMNVPVLFNIQKFYFLSGVLVYSLVTRNVQVNHVRNVSEACEDVIFVAANDVGCVFKRSERDGKDMFSLAVKDNCFVFVNGRKVTGEIELKHGDRISFGKLSNNLFYYFDNSDGHNTREFLLEMKKNYKIFMKELNFQRQRTFRILEMANKQFGGVYRFDTIDIDGDLRIRIECLSNRVRGFLTPIGGESHQVIVKTDVVEQILGGNNAKLLDFLFSRFEFAEMKLNDIENVKELTAKVDHLIENNEREGVLFDKFKREFEEALLRKLELFKVFEKSWIYKLSNHDREVDEFKEEIIRSFSKEILDKEVVILRKSHQQNQLVIENTIKRLRELCFIIGEIKKKNRFKDEKMRILSDVVKGIENLNKTWTEFKMENKIQVKKELSIELLGIDKISEMSSYYHREIACTQRQLIEKSNEIEELKEQKRQMNVQVMEMKELIKIQSEEIRRLKYIKDDEANKEVLELYPVEMGDVEKENYLLDNIYHAVKFFKKRIMLLSKYEMKRKKNWI